DREELVVVKLVTIPATAGRRQRADRDDVNALAAWARLSVAVQRRDDLTRVVGDRAGVRIATVVMIVADEAAAEHEADTVETIRSDRIIEREPLRRVVPVDHVTGDRHRHLVALHLA